MTYQARSTRVPVSHLFLYFRLLALLAVAPGAGRAQVLLDDTWADGTRANQNLPTDSAWFTTSTSNMRAFTNFLSVTNLSTSSEWWTYFTPSGGPVTLDIGDTLTLSLSFVPVGVAAQNGSRNMRFGLFDSTGSRASGDGALPTVSYLGYIFFSNFGVTWGTSSELRKRNTTFGNNDPLNSSSDSTVIGTAANTAGTIAFSNNVPYTLTLSISRTNASTTVFTTAYSGGGLTSAGTAVDTSGIYSSFDMFEIRPSGSSSTAASFNFTELKVTLVSAGSPPFINSQPEDQTAFTNGAATFTVDADGTAPLSYQWYFNTNTLLTDETNSFLALANLQPADSGSYGVTIANSFGSVTSAVAFLSVTVPVAPSISVQPSDRTVLPGASTTFNVIAGGSEPLSYQWYFNTTTPVANGSDSTLTLTNIQPADAGKYSVVVSNIAGSAASSNALLSVNTNPVAPVFSSQPASQVVLAGTTVAFTASAAGTAPISYQWNKNGAPIPGATSTTLTVTNAQTADGGSYTLTASNSVAAVTSDTAVLTVTPALPVTATAYNLTGFGRGTTGGGVIPESNPAYRKVFTPLDLASAIQSANKTAGSVKVIEIMNDLDLGWNEVGTAVQTLASTPFRPHATPKLHPRLLITGVSLIDIKSKSGLTIFSANGSTIRHACFNIKSTANIIVRNLKFDEMWEWDEASKGNYDGNDWDFIDLGNAGTVTNIWIDHCTFTKAYDGIADIKGGSYGITFSWCKYTGDDGASNSNSWVRQQISALETNKAACPMYNFLRTHGFSVEDIVTISQGHDKTHLIGANSLSAENAQHTVTFQHEWFINPWDRLPRLRAGNVHNYNIYVDDTLGLAARRLRDARAAAMSPADQSKLNNTYSFKPFLNGTISTESGAILVEKSIYIDCLTPLRNNQTDPSNPVYTGKVKALDSIYQLDSTVVRGNSTDPGNPLGPFQAAIIPFSWNLPGNQLPYAYTMDDPSQLPSLITSPTAGAGAGVLTWAKTNWLLTAYSPSAPVIVAPPQDVTVAPGNPASFVVVAGGSAPFTYQWFFNTNTPLTGATNAAFVIGSAQGTNAGGYSVIVGNGVGSVTSIVATLTVNVPGGFSAWQSANFTPAQLADPAISGPNATPANDGVVNLVKYALGLLPFVQADQPLATLEPASELGAMVYHRPASIPDVIYRAEVSTDLVNWSQSGVTQQVIGTDGNGLQIWQASYSGPASGQRYFRLLLIY